MTSRLGKPFPGIERLDNLQLGESRSENNGQSRRVCVVDTRPGWLFKEYRAVVSPADEMRLDRLIELPASLSLADRELVIRNTSWPVARVITEAGTIGVILPEAPSSFRAELTTTNGRTRTTMLHIDNLATTNERMGRLGLPNLSLTNRVAVCSSIAAVGALFERHGLVYLDWSYANAFWSTSELAAYVIDIDSCSFGPRLQTQTTGWADPLVPLKAMADNEVDRYRVALLVARCLTAERDIEAVLPAVQSLGRAAPPIREVADLVDRALTATSVEARPPLVELSAALTNARTGIPHQRSGQQEMIKPSSGVTGWTQVKRGPSHPPLPGPQPGGPPRTVPVPKLIGPVVRRTPAPPPPPVPASDDALTTQFGLALLGVLLFAGLLILIILVVLG